MMIIKLKLIIKAIAMALIILTPCVKVQAQDNSDIQRLRNGLLQSMNIVYVPTTRPEVGFEWEENRKDYSITRFLIREGNNETVPSYLLKPKKVKSPYPVMICLQGHSPGMYISIGEARSARDSISIAGCRDLATQVINNGWAALEIEQNGFGERAVEGEGGHQFYPELAWTVVQKTMRFL